MRKQNFILPTLLSSILSSPWMIEKSAAESYAPFILNLIKGDKMATVEGAPKNHSYVLDSRGNGIGMRSEKFMQSTDEEFVGVVEIRGAITKYSQFCGPQGTMDMASDIQKMALDPRVKSIILDIDSPGGEASYLQTLYNTIASVEKPVTAHYNGYCCSAAYYIASACDKIYANEDNDIVGSIGTMVTFYDMRAYFEKEGIKVHEVYADQSKNKNKLFKDAMDGKVDQLKSEILNPLAQQFIDDVSKKRNITNKEVFSGSTYSTAKAIEYGLIDGKMTIDELIKGELIKTSTNSKSNNTVMNKTWQSANSILGVEGFETHEGGVYLNEDQMGALNAALESKNTELPAATSTPGMTEAQEQLLTSLSTKVEGYEGKLTAQSEEIATLKAQLDKKPGAAATTTATPANEFEDGKEVDSWDDPNNPVDSAFNGDIH